MSVDHQQQMRLARKRLGKDLERKAFAKIKGAFRLVICGGRDFDDFETLSKIATHLLQNKRDVVIISGGAKGADSLGERYAQKYNIPIKLMLAKWDEEGRAAGMKRNARMLKEADAVLAFWDESSKGTRHTIELAKAQNIPIRVYTYKKT